MPCVFSAGRLIVYRPVLIAVANSSASTLALDPTSGSLNHFISMRRKRSTLSTVGESKIAFAAAFAASAIERASAERRKKMDAMKAEEERILRENEEWQKIHGKRERGQAVREILELVAQKEKEEQEKKTQAEKNKS